MMPGLTLISSVPEGGKYGLPHEVAQCLIREALEATTSGQPRSTDAGLRILYTADADDGTPARPLGSIGVILQGGKGSVWRLVDAADGKTRLGPPRRGLDACRAVAAARSPAAALPGMSRPGRA